MSKQAAFNKHKRNRSGPEEISSEEVSELVEHARRIASAVPDPELPFLTIADLGILRDIQLIDSELVVYLTPTYSGCPAVQVIEESVAAAMSAAGLEATITRVLSPAWSTDWISAEGRQKLLQNGIAPPNAEVSDAVSEGLGLFASAQVSCPLCQSTQTELVSAFGSTPCKSQYRCTACLEPFDYFKCH